MWVRGNAFGAVTLAADAGVFVVIGRHPECDVVLDDADVALRHLLVRSVALPSGGVALRVLDLHTDLGFGLVDGSRHASVFAEGAVAVAVGSHALVALPEREDLPNDLPSAEMRAAPSVLEPLAMSPYRANARPLRASRITLMPRPVMVGESLPSDRERASYALVLSRGGRSARVALGYDDLARGVMIGRSEKCHTELLRRITDVNTSRTHLLVLREQGATFAYDLASTQGTFLDGARVRRVALDERGTTLTLSRGPDAVRLTWHGP